ncbi:aldehyde dehydrogenase family protein [Egicoccus sp. AB-alg2]|uniref:aldehyde dehydrogenase family protein n=1 Tax=Egicoccus sp. AB-alg2 TaxID=3242693 RepID=UPI00359E1225
MVDTLVETDVQRMLIGGAWVDAASGEVIDSENPATHEIVGRFPAADADDVDRAVDAAAAAQPEWAAMPWTERGRLLRTLADRIRDRAREFALLDVAEAGLPLKGMLNDALGAAKELEYFAGLGGELKGSTIPSDPEAVSYTLRQPYGVVGRIVPFNHPFKFAVGKTAAPLLAGNAVLLKPPETASLSALAFGRLAEDLLPPGVLNIVTGHGAIAGAAIAGHPRIPRVAFTGSVPAGRAVMAAGAEHIKHVSLELGGKNPLVICPDADLPRAAQAAVKGMNLPRTMGQSCQSNSRIFVHDSVADRFLELLVQEIAALRIGDPTDEETDIGPVAYRGHYERILEHIAAAKEDGARLLTGGGRPDDQAEGYFVAPTVFDHVTMDMRIARNEVFGPVIAVLRWSDEDELLEQANAVDFGLTAKIWTKDLNVAQRFATRVEAGIVWINDHGAKPPGIPFGGFKYSGIGKEGSLEELISYTREKSIVQRMM